MPKVYQEVAAVYADGGLLSHNPTPYGLTWAWRHADADGLVLAEASGVITCEELGLERTENNLAETLALLFGLEGVPDGWAGTAYTDNKNALVRLAGVSIKMTSVPACYVERVQRVLTKGARKGRGRSSRLGDYGLVLLGGHPTREDLRKGYRLRDGKPVSQHNVDLDEMCAEEGVRWWRAVGRREVSVAPGVRG